VFNICPENTIREGYVTEKVFQAVEAGCIPIYDGPAEVEPKVLNADRILRTFPANNDVQGILSKEVWAPHALYYIYLFYVRMWCRVKEVYERKFCGGQKMVYRLPADKTITYTVASENEVAQTLRDHWYTHKKLFEPFALFFIPSSSLNIFTIEDAYNRGWLHDL
jgi:hypothetical protein